MDLIIVKRLTCNVFKKRGQITGTVIELACKNSSHFMAEGHLWGRIGTPCEETLNFLGFGMLDYLSLSLLVFHFKFLPLIVNINY